LRKQRAGSTPAPGNHLRRFVPMVFGPLVDHFSSHLRELAVARLLTVTRTCQMQLANALAYLTAAIRGHRRRQVAAFCDPKRLKC
jgi:hypothetical protein